MKKLIIISIIILGVLDLCLATTYLYNRAGNEAVHVMKLIDGGATFENFCNDFENTTAGLEVVISLSTGWKAIKNQHAMKCHAGIDPIIDVMEVQPHAYGYNLNQKAGYYQDLTHLADSIPYNDVMRNAIRSDDGKTYSLPYVGFILGVVYNKTFWAEHGQYEPTSYEDWVNTCEYFHSIGIQPLSTTWNGGNRWRTLLWFDIFLKRIHGSEWTKQLFKGVHDWTSQDVRKIFDKMEIIRERNWWGNASTWDNNQAGETTKNMQGQIAMSVQAIRNNFILPGISMFTFPKMDSDDVVESTGIQSLAAAVHSTNPSGGLRFMEKVAENITRFNSFLSMEGPPQDSASDIQKKGYNILADATHIFQVIDRHMPVEFTWEFQSQMISWLLREQELDQMLLNLESLRKQIYQRQVSPITIEPEAGIYQEDIEITLTTLTPNVTIWYSTTTTNPVQGGKKYDGPFILPKNAELYAVGVKPDFKNSDIRLQVYEIQGQLKLVSSSIKVLSIILAGLGVAVVLVLGGITAKFAKTPVFKASTVSFLYLLLIGCVCIYTTQIMVQFDSSNASQGTLDSLCHVKLYLIGTGFMLIFTTMLLKAHRIDVIFNSKRFVARKMTDGKLLRALAVFMTVEITINTLWAIMDPMKSTIVIDPIDNTRSDQCKGKNMSTWLTLYVAYKLIILLGSCWKAFRNRKISSQFGESKQLGLAMYNTIFVSIVAFPLTLLLTDINISAFISSVGLWIATTACMLIIFVPKCNIALRKPEENLLAKTSELKKGYERSRMKSMGVSSKESSVDTKV